MSAHAEFKPIPIKLGHDPVICAFEPAEDPLFPGLGPKLLTETEHSVIDWKTKLNQGTGKHPVWKIEFVKVPLNLQNSFDNSICTISIYFKNVPDDKNIEYVVAGKTTANENFDGSTIEVYYMGVALHAEQTRWTEGNYIYTKTTWTPYYTGYPASDPQLEITIRHEIGHALGLGHYVIDDNTRQKILTGEMYMPSIMIDTVVVAGVTHYDITPLDIDALKTKYGNGGFNNTEPVVVEKKTPSSFKEAMKSWVNNQRDDADFYSQIHEMSNNGIIAFPDNYKSDSNGHVPKWFKTTVTWWTNNKISDTEFVNFMQFMIDKKIL
jgi:hypothetical protein